MKSNKIPHLTWREYIAAVSALKRAIDNATRSGHKMTAKTLQNAMKKMVMGAREKVLFKVQSKLSKI